MELYSSVIHILLFFGGAFITSVIINAFFLRFSRNLGIKYKNDLEVRWSDTSKPSLGGISFYISYLMSFMFYAIIFGETDVFQNKELLGFFTIITMAFLLGLSDDAYDIRPLLKLLVQIGCGLVLIFTDNQIDLFTSDWLNNGLTVFWVVLIMNSINMLDNMDSIATVSSIYIILTMIGMSLPFFFKDNVEFFLLMAILGSLCGFLIFNWNPSKMFMGDTGSQFLGVFLAYFSIKFLWNNGVDEGTYSIMSNLTLVALTFAVPLVDTTFVVIRRVLRGDSPMKGGKDHTTHTLFYKGLTNRQVGFVFLLFGLASCLLALNVAKFIPVDSLVLILMWFYPILLLFFAFMLAVDNNESENSSKE